MNSIKKKIRNTKGKTFNRQMSDAWFCMRELFTGYARTGCSIGKGVSDTHNQQVNGTSIKETLNTLPSITPKLNLLSRLVMGGKKKSKTRRNIEMNNMKQALMKRIRRIIGVGRGSVFNSINEERKFVDREFGERQTEFPVPQTEKQSLHQDKNCEVQAEKRGKSVLVHEKTLIKDRVKSVKGICVGLARGICSIGKVVSEIPNRRTSNTPSSFNKAFISLTAGMNNTWFCMRELFTGHVREDFSIGKVVSGTLNQRVNGTPIKETLNTLPTAPFGRSNRLVVGSEKKNKTRRGLKMNNMKQTFMKRIRRIISVNAERRFVVLGSKFGELNMYPSPK